jgi:Flp pilus assembly protein TadG
MLRTIGPDRVFPLKGRSDTGQALVEMTLILPLLVLILLGTIDFGRVFYYAINLAQAANAGVQYGAQSMEKSTDSAGMEQAARAAAQDLGTITVSPAPSRYFACPDNTKTTEDASCSGQPPRVYVEVTVQKTFNTIVDYPGIPASVDIARTATMRVR